MGNPLKDLFVLRERINKLFEESHPRRSGTESVTWVPPVDVCETVDEYIVKAEIPDVRESDIDVRAEGDMLTLRGERRFQREGRHYHQVERSYGFFCRTFVLPSEVDQDAMTATLRDGMLRIVIPKKRLEPLRHIEITRE
jgi:HSP20 family protein